MGLPTIYDKFSMFINAKSQGLDGKSTLALYQNVHFLGILTSIQATNILAPDTPKCYKKIFSGGIW